jgi:hypothetical protein
MHPSKTRGRGESTPWGQGGIDTLGGCVKPFMHSLYEVGIEHYKQDILFMNKL